MKRLIYIMDGFYNWSIHLTDKTPDEIDKTLDLINDGELSFSDYPWLIDSMVYCNELDGCAEFIPDENSEKHYL